MKLIKNDLYLLLIDEEAEIKFNDLMYDSKLEIVIRYNSYNDGCYKIIAYYPLKEAKELDLPWLPNPFKGSVISAYSNYCRDNPTEKVIFKDFEIGYNAAQSKKFNLEDIQKAFEAGVTWHVNPNISELDAYTSFIQSLSTQQLHKEFVGWLSKKKCPYDFTSRCTIDRCDCEFVFETIVNSEDKEILVGTYKY